MTAQQTTAPSNRRPAIIAVALLLAALAVGSVTAVNLFPTSASERSLALPNRPAISAQAVGQAARAQQAWSERLNGLAAGAAAQGRASDAWTARLNGLAAGAAAQGRAADAWTARLNSLAADAGDLPSTAPIPTTAPWAAPGSAGSPYPPLPVPFYPTP